MYSRNNFAAATVPLRPSPLSPLPSKPKAAVALSRASTFPVFNPTIRQANADPTPLLKEIPAGTTAPKLTVVFDLDETLCYNRQARGPAALRPHAKEILKNLKNNGAEIILWTASMQFVAVPVVKRLDPEGTIFDHCIYRDRRWYSDFGYTKDIARLNRNVERTVLIENTPECCTKHPFNALLVPDYNGRNNNDTVLQVVEEVLLGLMEKPDAAASEYLKSHAKVGPRGRLRNPPPQPTAPTAKLSSQLSSATCASMAGSPVRGVMQLRASPHGTVGRIANPYSRFGSPLRR